MSEQKKSDDTPKEDYSDPDQKPHTLAELIEKMSKNKPKPKEKS